MVIRALAILPLVALAGCSGTEGPHMTTADVDTLLATEDDFDLCDGVFCAIADVTGNEIDLANEPEPCRTVTAIWHSGGIIGNGGFQYLFEGDFNGDPGYRITADAYKAIAADKSHSAFNAALALFPDSELPADIEERLQIFQSHPEKTRDTINSEFWDGDDDVKRLLAIYIRSHESEIREFLTGK